MELNLDFQNNFFKTICWIISILSWLLFILTGWIGFFKLAIKNYSDTVSYNNIWCFINIYYESIDIGDRYAPIQLNIFFYILIFAFLLIAGTIGFVLFMFKSTCQKEENVFEGMMGPITRFHFIPLICGTALFIQGITQKSYFANELLELNYFSHLNEMLDKAEENYKGFLITLIFSILGFFSIIVIQIKTEIKQLFLVSYTIKNGFYSCLIVLFIYSIFYSGIYIGIFKELKQYINDSDKNLFNNLDNMNKIAKNCGIVFSLFIGAINLYLGLFLKEIIIPILNAIIYLGFAIYFFGIEKEEKDYIDVSALEGANDIIILIISIMTIVFLVLLKMSEKNKPE